MFFRLLAIAALIGAASGCAAQQAVPGPPQVAGDREAEAAERGRQLAAGVCASCHAIGPAGASPLKDAPPFREIVRRHPLDELEAAFAEGLVTPHPAMPAFVFRASEIDDLVAWLETVKREP